MTSTHERLARHRAGRPVGWAFIDEAARGRNSGRSYAATVARIVVLPAAMAALLGAALGLAPARAPIAALLGVLLQYGPIVIAGAAVAWSAERSHRRSWRSLVAAGCRIDPRRIAIGLAAELAILAGQLALVHALTGWPWRFAAPASPLVFVVALVLIPLQAASEELLFRGYLTQALGRLVRSRILIALVVALVFGALHLDAYGPLTLPYFLLVSLLFSAVSLRDEGIELAAGGHAAMNLFAFVAAGTMVLRPATIGGEPGAVPFNMAALGVLLVNGAIFYGLTRLMVRLLCQGRPAR